MNLLLSCIMCLFHIKTRNFTYFKNISLESIVKHKNHNKHKKNSPFLKKTKLTVKKMNKTK